MVGRTSKRRHESGDSNLRQRRMSSVGDGDRPLGSPTPAAAGGTIHALVPEMPEPEAARFVSPSSSFALPEKPDYGHTAPMEFPDEMFEWNWDMTDGGNGNGGGGGAGDGDGGANQHLSEDSGSMTLLNSAPGKHTSLSSCVSTTAVDAFLPSFLPHDGGGSSADHNAKERMVRLMALCRMTYGLEARLGSRTGSLDEIMKLNKACLAEVVLLTSGPARQSGQVRRCSLVLIATCLDIMLVLFEDVVRSSGLDARSSSSARPDTRTMPSLQFGVFELDPQEQFVITRRILARELHNYRDVVQTLAAELQDTSDDFCRKLMAQWCLSLTGRLGQLLTSLEQPPPPGSSAFGRATFM